MIKGIARHAVIVKTPELKDVEQAIFIMSGAAAPQVHSQSELLALAGRLAGGESAAGHTRAHKALAKAGWFLAGGAAGAAAMLAIKLIPFIL